MLTWSVKISCLILAVISLNFCSSSFEKKRLQEINEKETEERLLKEENEKIRIRVDSLRKKLDEKFPSAINLDSIGNQFTYIFQESLSKSSNLLKIDDALIVDIEKQYDDYFISLSSYLSEPEVIGRFSVDSICLTRILTETIEKEYNYGCFVIQINELFPIIGNIYASGTNLEDEVHIRFSEEKSKYKLEGKILDFYLF